MASRGDVSGCLYRLRREILADKPRVTRFPVEFDPVEPAPSMAPEGAVQLADAAAMDGSDLQVAEQHAQGLDMEGHLMIEERMAAVDMEA